MIAFLYGNLLEKKDNSIIIDVQGVGYEAFCSTKTHESLGDIGSAVRFFVHTHYKADGVALYAFLTKFEKELFLELIKVDSVGPKSALNILSAASWLELVHLIEEGDTSGLSKLPKISKKTAEHLVVKLKGKLSHLILEASPTSPEAQARVRRSEDRQVRLEIQTALAHLGYKGYEIEKTLDSFNDETWALDFQAIIRKALTGLSGNV